MRSRVLTVCLVALVAVGGGALALSSPASSGLDESVVTFGGLGAWVDVYDYVPDFQPYGAPPSVSVKSVDDMAALGVKTLYLQAAQDDSRIEGQTIDPKLLGSFLRRAHDDDLRVVAWYLPKFADIDADLRRIKALRSFRSQGDRFDGIALDLEFTQGVADVATRNKALVKVSEGAREIVGDGALGAIVLEPLLLEDGDRNYWTNRNTDSGLRDGYRYTNENIKRLRKRLHDSEAIVHPIGGIADAAGAKDYLGFVRAARKQDAIGWSIYDFNTMTSGVWGQLR